MNDETNDGDADAGIGDVEGGPGMGERHVKIEEREIDDVAVHETIRQVAQDSGEKKGEGNIAQPIMGTIPSQKECKYENERDA